jgi:hypothetical protein
MSEQLTVEIPTVPQYLDLHSSEFIQMPKREMTPEYQQEVLLQIKLSGKVSKARLESLAEDAAEMGVPRAQFWEWLDQS